MTRTGRLTLGAVVAVYGVVVIVANAKNGLLPTSYTTEWVLFGSSTDIPGDFGRSLFSGSIAFGALMLVMAAAVAFTAGRRIALPIGVAAIVFGVLLIAIYHGSGNLLAARPPVSAVLVAVGIVLAASAATAKPAAAAEQTPSGDRAS